MSGAGGRSRRPSPVAPDGPANAAKVKQSLTPADSGKTTDPAQTTAAVADAAKRQDLPTKEARLIALQQFRAQILAAHLKHLQTGDYTALGIAAQDALLELEGKRESAA